MIRLVSQLLLLFSLGHSVPLTCVLLRVLTEQVALVKDTLFVSLLKADGLTEDGQAHVHGDQVRPIGDLEKLGMLETVT